MAWKQVGRIEGDSLVGVREAPGVFASLTQVVGWDGISAQPAWRHPLGTRGLARSVQACADGDEVRVLWVPGGTRGQARARTLAAASGEVRGEFVISLETPRGHAAWWDGCWYVIDSGGAYTDGQQRAVVRFSGADGEFVAALPLDYPNELAVCAGRLWAGTSDGLFVADAAGAAFVGTSVYQASQHGVRGAWARGMRVWGEEMVLHYHAGEAPRVSTLVWWDGRAGAQKGRIAWPSQRWDVRATPGGRPGRFVALGAKGEGVALLDLAEGRTVWRALQDPGTELREVAAVGGAFVVFGYAEGRGVFVAAVDAETGRVVEAPRAENATSVFARDGLVYVADFQGVTSWRLEGALAEAGEPVDAAREPARSADLPLGVMVGVGAGSGEEDLLARVVRCFAAMKSAGAEAERLAKLREFKRLYDALRAQRPATEAMTIAYALAQLGVPVGAALVDVSGALEEAGRLPGAGG